MQTEPELLLSETGWAVQMGLRKYADFVHSNKWVVKHLGNVATDPDDFFRFVRNSDESSKSHVDELSVGGIPFYNTTIMGRGIFDEVEKWEDIPEELQNWICELISVLRNYPELEGWFWWRVNYGIDLEIEEFEEQWEHMKQIQATNIENSN